MAGVSKRDELHEPLGLSAPEPLRVPWRLMTVLGVAALAVGAGVYAVETGDQLGGEPYAVASVDLHPPPPPAPAHPPVLAERATDTTPTGSVLPAPARPAGQSSATALEASSGIKV